MAPLRTVAGTIESGAGSTAACHGLVTSSFYYELRGNVAIRLRQGVSAAPNAPLWCTQLLFLTEFTCRNYYSILTKRVIVPRYRCSSCVAFAHHSYRFQ